MVIELAAHHHKGQKIGKGNHHAGKENGIQNNYCGRRKAGFYDTSGDLYDKLVRSANASSSREEVPHHRRRNGHVRGDGRNKPAYGEGSQFRVVLTVFVMGQCLAAAAKSQHAYSPPLQH